jgi:hypothetical protein
LVKDENGDLLAYSHCILNKWKNYLCQLLNVHGVNDVRQTEIHTAEPLVPEPSYFEVEIATESFKGQVVIKFRQNWSKPEGIHYVLRSTNLLIIFEIRKNCQSSGRNLLLYLFIRRVIKLTVVITGEYHCYQLQWVKTVFIHYVVLVIPFNDLLENLF